MPARLRLSVFTARFLWRRARLQPAAEQPLPQPGRRRGGRFWCMEMETTATRVSVGPRVGHRVFLAASLAAVNNLAFGYDVGVVSGSLADMAASLQLSTFEQEAATSGLNFVAGLGALLLAGNLLDRLGRRRAATTCHGGCNHMRWRLRPHATEAATSCDGGCNLTCTPPVLTAPHAASLLLRTAKGQCLLMAPWIGNPHTRTRAAALSGPMRPARKSHAMLTPIRSLLRTRLHLGFRGRRFRWKGERSLFLFCLLLVQARHTAGRLVAAAGGCRRGLRGPGLRRAAPRPRPAGGAGGGVTLPCPFSAARCPLPCPFSAAHCTLSCPFTAAHCTRPCPFPAGPRLGLCVERVQRLHHRDRTSAHPGYAAAAITQRLACRAAPTRYTRSSIAATKVGDRV